MPVVITQSLAGYFDILVFDPGETVGWAGVREWYERQERHIVIGQAMWNACMGKWNADEVYVESTPFAGKRTYDLWPVRFEGIVRGAMWPDEPLMLSPSYLDAARKWFSLPRGHGVPKHALDALTHLVGVLVRKSS